MINEPPLSMRIQSAHMRYTTTVSDGQERLVQLHEVAPGAPSSADSHALACAKQHLPSPLVERAQSILDSLRAGRPVERADNEAARAREHERERIRTALQSLLANRSDGATGLEGIDDAQFAHFLAAIKSI